MPLQHIHAKHSTLINWNKLILIGSKHGRDVRIAAVVVVDVGVISKAHSHCQYYRVDWHKIVVQKIGFTLSFAHAGALFLVVFFQRCSIIANNQYAAPWSSYSNNNYFMCAVRVSILLSGFLFLFLLLCDANADAERSKIPAFVYVCEMQSVKYFHWINKKPLPTHSQSLDKSDHCKPLFCTNRLICNYPNGDLTKQTQDSFC